MLSCTFFGHRDCPVSIRSSLRAVLIRLIETEGVTSFFVGNQGDFDAAVQSVLRDLQSLHRDPRLYAPKAGDRWPWHYAARRH